MPPAIAKLIGGAGTGKTRELLRIMEGVVDRIHDPHLLGFVSFTRAARREAAERAGERFGIAPQELERSGWFRTLHSVCYRCLGVQGAELLTDNVESRRWLEEAIQEGVSGIETDAAEVFVPASTEADKALQLWGTARNRLEPLKPTWERAFSADDRTPDYERCAQIIERYEQAKRLDGKLDFVDMLGRFAGYWFDVDGATKGEPDGEPPELPVWFHDEMQDVSKLSTAVFVRMVQAEGVQWVYLAGDPFQSIFGWSGADHHCFLSYQADKERIMPKSYRCPSRILQFGENILRICSDYWDRGIAPAEAGGVIDEEPFGLAFFEELDPRESWLLLARTNMHASRIAKLLDEAGLPWTSTRGHGTWNAPTRSEAIKALLSIEAGAPIDGSQWQQVLKHVPSSLEGASLLMRGTKSRFQQMSREDAQDLYSWVMPEELHELGATQAFCEMVRAGQWKGWIPGSQVYVAAIERFGEEIVASSGLRVGTIHSVKGAEADNVAVLSTISEPTFQSASMSQAGKDEEQRVWYVAATRAKKRLVVLQEKARFRKKLPL